MTYKTNDSSRLDGRLDLDPDAPQRRSYGHLLRRTSPTASYGSRRPPASPGAASPARSASITGRCTGGARAPSRPGERCTPFTRSLPRYPAAWRSS